MLLVISEVLIRPWLIAFSDQYVLKVAKRLREALLYISSSIDFV